MNLFSLLDASGRRFAARGAVYHGMKLLWTHAQLHTRALRLAAGLRARAAPGSRVVLVTENCPAYVETMFAVWAAGMVLVPVNYKLHALEIGQIVDDASPAWVLASPAIADSLAPMLAGRNACTLVPLGGTQYAELLDHAALPQAAAVVPDTLAWLFYTSGTTGRSKGAMLTHRNLMAMTVAHLADVDTIDEGASQLHGAPMSHGSGLYVPAYVARGARQVIPESGGFDPAEFLDLCEVHPDCGAFMAPTMVQRLRLEAERRGTPPAGLRTIVYGGGPMYLEEMRRSLAVFGPVFVQIYGQGESPMTITSLRRADHGREDAVLASVGWARTGVEVAVVDDAGQPVPPGENGEIVCRGDVVMAGYWQNDEATAQALRGGWLHTGDIGSMDATGCLTLRDRSKDLIISGGSNIYPREVEEVLLTHPQVAEACVVGEPDAEWGEAVVAFVVARTGGATPAALDAHCIARIARFKRPKRYVFVAELPKNSYGKVLKRLLRQQLDAPAGNN